MRKTRIMAIIAALFVTYAYSNEVYIEQVGSGTTVAITQQGSDNKVGTNITPVYIGNGSNTVTIDQIGSMNILAMVVNGASTNVTLSTTGSGNDMEVQCGTSVASSCSGSVIMQTIVGDNNITKQLLGSGANHTSTMTITGDTNTVTHTSTSTGTTSATITVTGNTNTVGVTQSGTLQQTVVVDSTGNNNNINIVQSN